MRNKNAKYLLIASVVLIVIGYFIFNPQYLGSCEPNQNGYCRIELSRSLGEPLVLASLVGLFPVSLILMFIKEEVFKTWSKFAMVAIPLAVIWIALTPVQSSSGAIAGIGIAEDRESVTWI